VQRGAEFIALLSKGLLEPAQCGKMSRLLALPKRRTEHLLAEAVCELFVGCEHLSELNVIGE